MGRRSSTASHRPTAVPDPRSPAGSGTRGSEMTATSADERTDASPPAPTGAVRYQVLGAFSLLAAITYLDRVCMAQAAGSIREELRVPPRLLQEYPLSSRLNGPG